MMTTDVTSPSDVISHIVCDNHKPVEAIPYHIAIEPQQRIRCERCEERCEALASNVWFTPRRERIGS